MRAGHRERLDFYAERLVRQYGLSVPVNVRDLAHRLGIDIHEAPFTDTFDGALCPYPELPGQYLIFLNSLHHERRKRYTLAHELGHYFLHEPTQLMFSFARHGRKWSTSQEREANAFAASLLMPRSMVLDEVRNFGRNPQVLAVRFEVSRRSMEIRLEELRLMG